MNVLHLPSAVPFTVIVCAVEHTPKCDVVIFLTNVHTKTKITTWISEKRLTKSLILPCRAEQSKDNDITYFLLPITELHISREREHCGGKTH